MDQNNSSENSERSELKSIGIYKEIIKECFHIHISTIQFIGGGSYRVFEVNNNLIFKFTHEIPPELLKREKDVCDSIRDNLSVPIPHYLYFSDTCPSFKGAVGGYQKLEGTSLEGVPIFDHTKTAHQIGQFLSELHAIDLNEEFSHEKAHTELTELYNHIQKAAFPFLNKKEQQWTQSLFEDFLDDKEYWNFTPVFVHGDFDSSNILYQSGKGMCGIIDFEEAGMGDPAWDFCCLLAEYGINFLKTALKSYQGIKDETLLKRIQFHSKRTIFHELLYGIEYNQPEFTAHGLTRLHKAMNNCHIIGGWLNQSMSLTRREGFPG